jgi:hypothetical protein
MALTCGMICSRTILSLPKGTINYQICNHEAWGLGPLLSLSGKRQRIDVTA